MPVYLDDPSVLTKERLKSELRAHNVELPGGNPTKDVYVQLYVKTVSAQSHGTDALDAFSSDEELPPPLVSQNRRSRSSGRQKSAAVALEQLDTAQMSDEDLREQLLKQGVDAGPIVASTRKLYERKLMKLLDNEAILSVSQSHSNSGETEVYSDQEEEVPVAPEPDLKADVELEPAPVKSNSSNPPSAQRRSSSQRSVTKHVEQVEKTTAAEETALPELSAATGLTATCRPSIKGAAGLPVKHDTTHTFQSHSSVGNSTSTTTCSAPSNTSSAPSAASSAFSSASSTPSSVCQVEACGMSWWKKLLLLLVLLLFVFLVYQAMEPNGAAPSGQEEL